MKKIACVFGALALATSGLIIAANATAARSTPVPVIVCLEKNHCNALNKGDTRQTLQKQMKLLPTNLQKQMKVLPTKLCLQNKKLKCIRLSRLLPFNPNNSTIKNLCKGKTGKFCVLVPQK